MALDAALLELGGDDSGDEDPDTPENKTKESTAVTKKVYKNLNRQIVFPTKTLETEADIDAYVEKMREQLKQLMKNCDGLKLN